MRARPPDEVNAVKYANHGPTKAMKMATTPNTKDPAASLRTCFSVRNYKIVTA